jgi:two-component system chemotaxis response regulator CheY
LQKTETMKKILITDDSGFSRKVLRKILESENYQVVEASNGNEALEVFVMEQPDVVMLDLNMAHMGGMEVLEKLIALNSEAKVIIASADIQESTREEAFRLGASAYIKKPFQTEDVLTTLAKL